MANAVFNSLESYFAGNKLKPRLDWSKFDMSNIRSLDMDMGILYPIYLEDCLPGDKIKLGNTIKVQALPLKNPIFNNFKIYTYYYYVPYYLLWHKFDRYIEGGRDGTYTAELPYIKLPKSGAVDPTIEENYPADATELDTPFGPNTLYDYMGFETIKYSRQNLNMDREVSAFPFAAYQRIWRDYFMNQDVQTTTNVNRWFPEDDFDFQLVDGENFLIGQDTTEDATIIAKKLYNSGVQEVENDYLEDRPMLLSLRARNFNKDYFTSMWFSPQRGQTQTQTVPINGTVNFNEIIADNGLEISPDSAKLLIGGSRSEYEQKLAGQKEGENVTSYKNLIANTLNKTKISGGFKLADLHLAQQIEIWMERNMSVKAQYNEFLRIHFDDAPLDERLTKPAYIGGTVQDIQISEVIQTSQTTETSAQGTATGHATSYENGYVGTYHSHEYGLILGLACIMPEIYYNTGVDRHWTKETRYDWYFPEFADLEPQAVLRKEYYSNIRNGDEPIGYIGRYDEYRHHRSLAVGCFRNGEETDFTSWVITRSSRVKSEVKLDQAMISSSLRKNIFKSPNVMYYYNTLESKLETLDMSNIKHEAWASGNTVNPFIVQVGIGCEMVRPLPYVNDPTRQGR